MENSNAAIRPSQGWIGTHLYSKPQVERAPLCAVFLADLECSRLAPRLINITADVPVHDRLPSRRSLRMTQVCIRVTKLSIAIYKFVGPVGHHSSCAS